jgi:hypothetical protein
MNGKCVYSKNKCVVDVCQSLTVNDCEKSKLCHVDGVENCAYDPCSEGSDMNDAGVNCSSLTGCGYEAYDDTCKTTTGKFTSIDVGSVLGIV